MANQFNASAITAGSLISTSTFAVPAYQREYAWGADEYSDFWSDLQRSLSQDSYFLGLVILTKGPGDRKLLVDGQQRLISITLLSAALYHEALANQRQVLADRIRADFLRAIDYESDDTIPRIVLADPADNTSLQRVVAGERQRPVQTDEEAAEYSRKLYAAADFIATSLHADLQGDPFRRLGLWTDFLTNRVLFAAFVHPDAGSAYRVFEVINTRGRQLTTADLLKNWVLSETPEEFREQQYQRWQRIAKALAPFGDSTFVQYIRHVVTVEAGHILPKDLYDYVSGRLSTTATPPDADQLVDILERTLGLYLQMLDPAAAGPAGAEIARIFEALGALNVIAVRPLLLAINDVPDAAAGMQRVLELVVRRIVVGNLGTGNVERRFGEAAHAVRIEGSWEGALNALRDLNPPRADFVAQLSKRSLARPTLDFLRHSVVQQTKTPDIVGFLHFIRPRHAPHWPGFEDEDLTFWYSTIGNTLLASQERRPTGATSWEGVRQRLLPLAIDGERAESLADVPRWDADAVEAIGIGLAEEAGAIWY